MSEVTITVNRRPYRLACEDGQEEHLKGLAARIDAMAGPDMRAVLSFGIGGGLVPGLPAGTIIIATDVVARGARWRGDPRWRDALATHLSGATTGIIAGSDEVIGDPSAKALLHRETGATDLCVGTPAAGRAPGQKTVAAKGGG